MAETRKDADKVHMTLIQKLQMIQTEMKAPKNLYNSFGKYKYRNAESILEALKPYEDKYKVTTVITDTIEEVGGRIYVVAIVTLYDCTSDATISVSARAREEENKKGMDQAQLTGATSSYARKYALNGLFLLDDTKDADSDEYHNETESRSKAASDKAQGKTEDKPAMTEAEKKKLKDKQVEFVNFCNANGIDYHDYKLTTKSTYADFDNALADAKARVDAKNSGGELPFPIDTESEG